MTIDKGTVFLVDDDARVLHAISRLLREMGFDVKAFNSPIDFLDQHKTDEPGCAILDVAMPGLSGLDLQAALSSLDYQRPIIFITGGIDVATSVHAMKVGAVDLLLKPVQDNHLLAAVETALEKDRVARHIAAEVAAIRQRFDSLTPREQEVLAHVVAGRLNKQIAGDLGTAEKTIKVHRARVMDKMKARSLAELVRLAEQIGISEPTSAAK